MCICRKKKRATSPTPKAIMLDGPKIPRSLTPSTIEKPKVDDVMVEMEKPEEPEPKMETAIEKTKSEPKIVEKEVKKPVEEEEEKSKVDDKNKCEFEVTPIPPLDTHYLNYPHDIKNTTDLENRLRHKKNMEKMRSCDEETATIEADKTQKSAVMEPDWNEDYRKAERPIWVMDEKHDEIANNWLNKMPRNLKIYIDGYYWVHRYKPKNSTFHAYEANRDLITISKPDVVPCQDQHRVIVKFPGLDRDYIHANYVGPKANPKQFICTQTPQFERDTLAFWAMVIQEKVEQIVSLEDSHFYYVPKKRFEKICVGKEPNLIYITNVKTRMRFETIVEYELKLNWGNGHGRNVSVYHYPNWRQRPHYSHVLLLFLKIVWNSRHTVVVHCYTGIGLSAVLIVVALVHQKMYDGENGLNINVTLAQVRNRRYGAIENFYKYWTIQMTLRLFFEQECFNRCTEPEKKHTNEKLKDRKVYHQ